MKDQSIYIKQLICKYIQGDSSVDETAELGRWLSASEKNQSAFKLLKKEAEEEVEEQSREEWNNFTTRYALSDVNQRKFRISPFIRYAAAVLIIVSTALGVYTLHNQGKSTQYESLIVKEDVLEARQTRLTLADGDEVNVQGGHANIEVEKSGNAVVVEETAKNTQALNKDAQLNKLVVPYGKTARITLADGTKVWLNAGSRLVFPLAFEKKTREVFLQGEAFFDVHHDEEKPFKVLTKDLKFTVLGTSFNINAYEDNKEVAAVLVDGSLKVESKEFFNKKQAILKPGQKSAYNSSARQMKIADVETDYYTSWKEGYLLMRKSSVASVVNRLKRYYHQEVKIADEVLKKNHRITGKLILTEKKEQTFAALCEITNMKYFNQNDTILLVNRD